MANINLFSFVIAFISLSTHAGNKPYQASEAELAVNFQAKEYCSCRYIAKRSDKECREYIVVKGTPNGELTSNEAEKSVKVALAGVTALARWTQPEFGCRLD